MSHNRKEPEWLSLDIAMAVHDRQLSEHGGPTGVRDQGALESVLGRPVNQWTYGEGDLCALAAAYAFGIARNPPFTDGNKRTAWVFARVFLRLNSQSFSFGPKEAIDIVLALDSGLLSEKELADWFRARIVVS